MSIQDKVFISALRGKLMDRIAFGDEEDKPPWYVPPSGKRCPDCDVKQGDNHKPGCDREQCPVCGTQLIGCDHGDTILDEVIV